MYAVDLKIPFDFPSPLRNIEQFNNIPKPDAHVRETWHRVDLDPSQLDPNLISWLAEKGISVPVWDIFCQPPQFSMHIHIDQHDVFDNATKLNFAYSDAKTGTNAMRWYSASEEDSTVKKNAGGWYRSWSPENVDLIHSHNIGTPSLVNAGKPHNVVNLTDKPRICISLILVKTVDVPENLDDASFVKYLQWDEAVEIFKEYICQTTTST